MVIGALIAVTAFTIDNSEAQSTTADIYAKSKRSVVLLLACDSSGMPSAMGTGFFVTPTKIATNAHVVKFASKVIYRVLGTEGTLTAVGISNYSESLDLAVLDAAREGTPLKLSVADSPQIGEKVVVIGNPRGLEGSVSEGIVAGIRGSGPSRLIQITAPISPGNSGGPVFTSQGEVIGVATSTLRNSQNINFAVPIGLLSELRTAGKSWEPQTQDRERGVQHASGGIEFVEFRSSGSLGFFHYSIQNKNEYAIKNLHYLIVLRNRETRNVVSYKIESMSGIIPPGLLSF
jgi:S1-C subfamily serine protease